MDWLAIFRRNDAKALPAPQPQTLDPSPSMMQRLYQRMDSLRNLVTGLGITGADRRMGMEVYQRQPLVLNQQYFLFQQSWKARRAVEATPRHAVRAWVKVTIPDNPDATAALQRDLERFRKPFRTAGIWANLTGGGLAAMIIDDGRDPTFPVDLRRIRGIRSVKLYDRWFAYPASWNQDPMAWNSGEPEIYSVFGSATVNPQSSSPLAQIHASRCVRFDGPLLPILLRQANVGWNSSLLEYCWDALRDHQQGLDSGAKALTVFSQMFLTRKGFDQDLIAPDGENLSDMRLRILSSQLNMGGVAMLDETDKIEALGQKVSGFADVLDRLGDELAGAFEIPRVILYGQANGTSRAGADTDVRMYYDSVKEWSHDNLVPAVRQVVELLLASPKYKALGIDADDVDIEPNSLWELSDKERAEIIKLNTDAVVAANGTGVISPKQAHLALVEALEPLGVQADDEMLSNWGDTEPDPDDPNDATLPVPDPDRLGQAGMPPLAGLNNYGMPIIPGPDSGPGG